MPLKTRLTALGKFFCDYFGLFALGFIAASALAGAVIRRSVVAGLLAGLAAVVVIIAFLILLGLEESALALRDELRAGTSRQGTSLIGALARAWAKGLFLWVPPETRARSVPAGLGGARRRRRLPIARDHALVPRRPSRLGRGSGARRRPHQRVPP